MGSLVLNTGLLMFGALLNVSILGMSAKPAKKDLSGEVKVPLFVKPSNELGSDRKSTKEKIKVPQYMLDLFASLTENKTGRRRQNVSLPGSIVRSFYSQVLPANENLPADLVFNISDILNSEVIRKCQLRVYRKKSKSASKMKEKELHIRQIKVRLLDTGASIANKRLESKKFGWVQFDVTSAVKYALRRRSQVREILLKLSVFEIQGRENEDKLEFAFSKRDMKEPILVVYTDSKLRPEPTFIASNKSDFSLEDYVAQMKGIGIGKRSKKRLRRHEKPVGCHREDMFVDFRKMGMDWLIIKPLEFNAYRCSGTCKVDLSLADGTATNHAVIQSVFSNIKHVGTTVPLPCCSPKELESRNFLVVDKPGQKPPVVKLVTFTAIVAKSCGCL